MGWRLRSLVCLARDGGAIVVGRDDDVVEVGAGEQGVKEGPGVGQAKLLDEDGVCDKSITPAHLDGVLRHALYEEESCGAELQAATARNQLNDQPCELARKPHYGLLLWVFILYHSPCCQRMNDRQ